MTNTEKRRSVSKIDPQKILGQVKNISATEDKEAISNALREVKTQADVEKLRDYLLKELHQAMVNGDEITAQSKLKAMAKEHVSSLSRKGGGYTLVNTHLILKQLPTATVLGTAKKWKALGYHPLEGIPPVQVPAGGGARFRVPSTRDASGKWRKQTLPLFEQYQKANNLTNADMAALLGIKEKNYVAYKYGEKYLEKEAYKKSAEILGTPFNINEFEEWGKKFRWTQGGCRIISLYDLGQISPDDPSRGVPVPPTHEPSMFSEQTTSEFIRNILKDENIKQTTENIVTPYSVVKKNGGIVCITNESLNGSQKTFAELCGLCAALAVKEYGKSDGLSKKLEENLPAIANLAAYITALRYDVPCGGVKECVEACGKGISLQRLGVALDTALNIAAKTSMALNKEINNMTQNMDYAYLDLFEERGNTRVEEPVQEVEAERTPITENTEQEQEETELPDLDELMFI